MSWLKAFIISLIMMTHLELYIKKKEAGIKFQLGWHRGEKDYLRPCMHFAYRDFCFM